MSTPNYSVLSIAAFYVLALIPQVYGTIFIYRRTNGGFNNANPRGVGSIEHYKKTTDKATFAKWERIRGAHNNALENFSLFAAAVICANIAGLDVNKLNLVCGSFLAFRTVHSLLYILVTSQELAGLRSLAWMGGASSCIYLLVKSGILFMDGRGARGVGL